MIKGKPAMNSLVYLGGQGTLHRHKRLSRYELAAYYPKKPYLTLKTLSKRLASDILFYSHYFSEKIRLGIPSDLLSRWFTWNVKPNFLWKTTTTKQNKIKMSSVAVVISTSRVRVSQNHNESIYSNTQPIEYLPSFLNYEYPARIKER